MYVKFICLNIYTYIYMNIDTYIHRVRTWRSSTGSPWSASTAATTSSTCHHVGNEIYYTC